MREDKNREANDGHDGTWVAHPGLVGIALEEFDKAMPQANQIDRLRDDVEITAKDLIELPEGEITEQGLRTNISVGIQYMAHWLGGNGCVPLYNLMEDAATAEISRTQVWQWVHHPKGVLSDGRKIDLGLVHNIIGEEMAEIQRQAGPELFKKIPYQRAAELFEQIVTDDELAEFLTLKAYDDLK